MQSMKISVIIIVAMTILYHNNAHGQNIAIPDLRAEYLEINIRNGDWQSLNINGIARATIANYSKIDIRDKFSVIVFDDINGDDKFTADRDALLGGGDVVCCDRWQSKTIDIDIMGKVRFRDSVLSIEIDDDNSIKEINEQNNYTESDPNCTYRWKPLDINIDGGIEHWRWIGGNTKTPSRRVQTSPVVHDIDGDGKGEILFASHENRDIIDVDRGILRGIDNIFGRDVFISDHNVRATSELAVADIDRNGTIEIIGMVARNTTSNAFRATIFNSDGSLNVDSEFIDEVVDWGGASVADLDHDGYGDLVVCGTVVGHDGRVIWRGSAGRGRVAEGCLSSVADIDMDGNSDIVAGNTAYDNTGKILWSREDIDDGLTGIGNFDNDLLPEIVLVTDRAQLYLLDSDGATIWGPVEVPGRANHVRGGGAPTLADFDGDGNINIGVANNSAYTVFDMRGNVLWSNETSDPGGRSAASAFDFNADGSYEVIYGDEQFLRIYDGKTGSVVWETKRPAGTSFDLPVVVDADQDDMVEIYTGVSSGYTAPESVTNPPGVYSFIGSGSPWGWSRAIWNQLSYHITNIDDVGIVPIFEYPSWLDHNTYRASVIDSYDSGVPDVTTSKIVVNPIDGSRDVNVSIRIGNGGRLNLPVGISIAVFDGDPAADGKLIGSTITRNIIRYNEYMDMPSSGDQQIIWRDPPVGNHKIYAVADYGDILTECRIDNNAHWVNMVIDEGGSVTPTETASAVASPPNEVTPTRSPVVTPSPGSGVKRRYYIPFVWRSRRVTGLFLGGEGLFAPTVAEWIERSVTGNWPRN